MLGDARTQHSHMLRVDKQMTICEALRLPITKVGRTKQKLLRAQKEVTPRRLVNTFMIALECILIAPFTLYSFFHMCGEAYDTLSHI